MKLKKVSCEICGESSKATLHTHHIVERTNPESTEDWSNLCVICANCHNKVHANTIKIIGVYPSTKPPYGRFLVFEENGISNLPGVKDPYIVSKPKSMRLTNVETESSK
jgi:hypothetical protein